MSARQALILLVTKNQMLRLTTPNARTRQSPLGKTRRRGRLTTVGLRPPFVSQPRRHSHPDCRSLLTLIVAQHLPPSLHYLPWELLRDPRDPPGNFFALNGSIIRYDSTVPEKDFEPVELPFKTWFLFANPSNRPFSGDTDVLLPSQSKIIFDRITPATFDRFQQVIRGSSSLRSKPEYRPVVFAFFGHGDIDAKKIGQLVFVKEGERKGISRPWVSDPRPCYAISTTMVACPFLRVVFLCACETAWAETATAFENSIAGTLLRNNAYLGYVIGAQTPIDRFAADIFLGSMLTNLLTTPLDIAVSDARAAVQGMSYADPGQQYSSLDWWVPVLYTRAAGFNLIARREHQPTLQPPARVADPAVLGLDATSGEPISLTAMGSEIIRRLTALFSATRREIKVHP